MNFMTLKKLVSTTKKKVIEILELEQEYKKEIRKYTDAFQKILEAIDNDDNENHD